MITRRNLITFNFFRHHDTKIYAQTSSALDEHEENFKFHLRSLIFLHLTPRESVIYERFSIADSILNIELLSTTCCLHPIATQPVKQWNFHKITFHFIHSLFPTPSIPPSLYDVNYENFSNRKSLDDELFTCF